MNLYTTQQSIVTKLTAFFAETPFTAFDLPDAPSDFQKAVQNPIVYVAYTGSKADPSVSTNVIVQPRKAAFSIEIHARSLYKANGMFITRHAVELALIGFAPTNCHRMYLLKDEINQTTDGIWIHSFQFECETMLVQADETEVLVGGNFAQMYLTAVAEDTIQVIPVAE